MKFMKRGPTCIDKVPPAYAGKNTILWGLAYMTLPRLSLQVTKYKQENNLYLTYNKLIRNK